MSNGEAVDFSIIEMHKENIEPSTDGRSALALKQLFSTGNSQLKEQQALERSRIEEKLKEIDELDDPLEPHLEYIEWLKRNHPSGPSAESGLIQVMERCTSQFRDVSYYKNDPRYLKVWLSYAKYSENPRDIFIYLARKEIGKQLATYYEEYANYLETNERNMQADKVYREGIKQLARPFKRLQKRFEEFRARFESKSISSNEPQSPVFPVRSALSMKSGTSLFAPPHQETRESKNKIEIFADGEESKPEPNLKSGGWEDLGSASSRNKENKIEATSWAGEKLPQNLTPRKKNQKIPVFSDSAQLPTGPVFKIIEIPGKKREKVDLNFDLLYQNGEEFCVHEVLAMMKGVYSSRLNLREEEHDSPRFKTLVTQINKTEYDETIKLNKEVLKKRASPTATMYTKEAEGEIEAMFNQEIEKIEKWNNDQDLDLIYDDLTENFNHELSNDLTERVSGWAKRQREELHDVRDIIRKKCIVNPADEALKEMLLQDLNPSLPTYKGFYRYTRNMNMCSTLKKSLNLKQSRHVFVEFDGTQDPFNLKCLLGEGGFASVYLAESMTGEFKAIKCQTPSSAWEFYILKQIEDRLMGNSTMESIVRQSEMHVYSDESYLILEYIKKGTILDVVNFFKTAGRKMEESLVVFITSEILKVISSLHTVRIMHGDLKPDNCMLRFDSGFEEDRSKGWRHTGIKLIDFGRSIDMTLFPKNVEFKSNWATDNQDCPEMRNQETWTYQADYYGIASIIHTMLFGSFIETKFDGKKHVLVNPIKRYWQQDMWSSLFDVLLNSKSHGELPLTNDIDTCIRTLERWLINNDSNLVKVLKDIELGLK